LDQPPPAFSMNTPYMLLLGTGNAESLKYWNTNALVHTEDGNLLIDCGYTIKHALADVGMDLADIDAVFITHIHGDHVFGLERLGFESRYSHGRRIRLTLEPAIHDIIWDQCLKGSMGYSGCGENRLEDFFDVTLVEGGRFEYGGCRFQTFPTPHTVGKPSFGLRINDRVIFTSDTKAIPDLIESDVDLIIHDCTLQEANPVHATYRELLAVYPERLRQRMLLIHLDDEVDGRRAELEAHFLGIARQGQTIPL
jgi:ribonuclease BN (tRNA processing enzyme)